jgi:hypothetical protein
MPGFCFVPWAATDKYQYGAGGLSVDVSPEVVALCFLVAGFGPSAGFHQHESHRGSATPDAAPLPTVERHTLINSTICISFIFNQYVELKESIPNTALS